MPVYNCDHCNKRYVKKVAAESHENLCSRNPENFMACLGCENLVIHDEEYYVEKFRGRMTDGGDDFDTRTCKAFFCKKLQTEMYPHKAVQKGLLEKYPESFEDKIKMPVTCEFYVKIDDSNLSF